MSRPYHHGDLRAQVLRSAADLVATDGPDALSMRDLARRAGVSHAAPAHHFGDRSGLFTALAAEGFDLLASALAASVGDGRFDRTAVAYVRFAVAHPGHYAVMFRADLVDAASPLLLAARTRAGDLLADGLASVPADRVVVDPEDARRAAWALVHGLSTLWLSGALPGVDPEVTALAAAHQLFGSRDG
ncbi:TetR/AcrR family transcriptional regulator [Cellulomonas sp. SLBN-39]|uniref:TetR/AcrR family transcriptional regulator n=1 Tax=Cellulomonas sp. SLBN-39 TaxID=2768446 RepID=UPI001151EEA3|nr:TetR/AcrR family transcriptional regulator [Cellulomonas sp. SLBN-39]TQL03138.1 TetR family transcriptional regulator [Cellulomonas sp. SLBN-39]